MKTIVNTLCVFALGAGLLSCTKEAPQDSSPQVRVEVRTAIVRKGSIDDIVAATGSTVVRREAQLRSPITGVLAQFSYFNGDEIPKGTSIALVRSKESSAALQGAEQLLGNAKSDRQREEARKAIELTQNSANAIAIRAPFNGILSGKAKNEMEVVSEGDVIASFVDPSSMMFVADVSSSYIRLVRQGQYARVKFSARPGKWYRGRVHRIEPQANTADQTVRVQIAFDEQKIDLAGSLFGEASIVVGKRENVLLVPAAAILHDDERNATNVVLVGADSLAHRVDVRVGVTVDSTVEISSPSISEGSIVITQGHYGLPDSTSVQIGQ